MSNPLSVNEREQDLDDFLEIVQGYWTSFPDIELEPTHLIRADDYVAVRMEFAATGNGEYYGHDIDGKEIESTETFIFQVNNSQIAGYLYNWDELGFWSQLGVLESPYAEE